MTRITATEATRNISDILNRAQFRGESFEVTQGDEVVVKIEAVKPKRLTVGEFREIWKNLPPLDPENAAAWEEDQKLIRASAPAAPYKWD